MRSIVLILPLLIFVLAISIIVLLIYSLISLVKANQKQAESLKQIEITLKKIADTNQ